MHLMAVWSRYFRLYISGIEKNGTVFDVFECFDYESNSDFFKFDNRN